ncbi:MAG TPA: MFS transporter [Candidatus Saccharimonadales bacterium]|jgi:EmrB/QacA subfamily drug resistance transporter|nr:MFS transporter [Candidatus Saccharimonadales bacterium]
MADKVRQELGKEAVESTEKKQTSHWLVLVLLALAQFMVILDVSIVNVALPSIQTAFHMTSTTLQWVVTAYTLTFGGFLLLGGRAADLFGRRRIFLAGITVFTLASLGTGLSQGSGMLIVFRALQGLAGAFMSPAALSIILVTYREGHERNVALSVWGAVAAGGAAVGVLAGGILTQYLGWRWNFFINVPVGIGVIITSLRILGRHESTTEHNDLDLPGAILVTGGLMGLVYALVKAPTSGWTQHTTLTYFGLSIAALVIFLINESRVKNPLMPLRIFRIRNLSGADLLQLLMAAGMFSIFFFSTLYLQEILGYSPVKTGFSFLIIPIIIAIAATNVPRLVAKVGYRPILMVAPLFVSAGLFWLSHIPVNGTFWGNVAPGMILLAFGMGSTFVSVSIAATSGVPSHEAGLASGLLNTAQQIGGSLGLAVLTGIAASASSRYITNLNLHGAPSHNIVATATVHGFHDGYLIASTFGIAASLLATFVIRAQSAKTDPSHGEVVAVA